MNIIYTSYYLLLRIQRFIVNVRAYEKCANPTMHMNWECRYWRKMNKSDIGDDD